MKGISKSNSISVRMNKRIFFRVEGLYIRQKLKVSSKVLFEMSYWHPRSRSGKHIKTYFQSCFIIILYFRFSFLKAIRAHNEAIQGVSWKCDGSLLVTTSKDKSMQILDPRNATSSENLVI